MQMQIAATFVTMYVIAQNHPAASLLLPSRLVHADSHQWRVHEVLPVVEHHRLLVGDLHFFGTSLHQLIVVCRNRFS